MVRKDPSDPIATTLSGVVGESGGPWEPTIRELSPTGYTARTPRADTELALSLRQGGTLHRDSESCSVYGPNPAEWGQGCSDERMNDQFQEEYSIERGSNPAERGLGREARMENISVEKQADGEAHGEAIERGWARREAASG
jgi:hypothetical protein